MPAASREEIVNMALRYLGHTVEIAVLDTDQTEAGATMRAFYDNALDVLFNAYTWPFATRTVVLTLVEDDPTEEWDYSYRYPPEAERIRRILSGTRRGDDTTIVPYRIVSDTVGRLIYTDQITPSAEITVRETNIATYPAYFVRALVWRLAADAALSLAKEDKFKFFERAEASYAHWLSRALATAKNEIVRDPAPESEFIRERDP